MARATVGNHVWLRPGALPELRRVYADLTDDAIWTVVVVDSGYGERDGLHLESPTGRRILAWRHQVRAVPRCDACGLEGHTMSKGTARTCPAQAELVKETRLEASRRMKKRWVAIKAGELPAPRRATAPVEAAS